MKFKKLFFEDVLYDIKPKGNLVDQEELLTIKMNQYDVKIKRK